MTDEHESDEKVKGGTGLTSGGDMTFGDINAPFAVGNNNVQNQLIEQQINLEELRKSLLDFQKGVAKLNLSPDYQSVVNGDISAANGYYNK